MTVSNKFASINIMTPRTWRSPLATTLMVCAATTAIVTNAVIPPANDVEFGFSGSWTSNPATPTTFSMNGVACAVG